MIALEPIGVVRSPRTERLDDDSGPIESVVALDPERFEPSAVRGGPVLPRRGRLPVRPRRSRARPAGRPNRIGVSRCELLGIDGLHVRVRALDAIDETPVLDLKPHMTEFDARGPVRQPAWSHELMAGYW